MEIPEGFTHAWTVDEISECQRLDKFIAEMLPEYSRTFLQRSIKWIRLTTNK